MVKVVPQPIGQPSPSDSFDLLVTSRVCKLGLGAGRSEAPSSLCSALRGWCALLISPISLFYLLEPLPRGWSWLPLPPIFLVVYKVSLLFPKPGNLGVGLDSWGIRKRNRSRQRIPELEEL